MKKKDGHRFFIGGASIILLLVVISLTLFAILSIRASYHELRLAKKTTAMVEEYYLADAKAEDILMRINEKIKVIKDNNKLIDLENLYSEIDTIEGVTRDREQDNLINYEIKINEISTLMVQLDLTLEQDMGVSLKVRSWKMVTNEKGDYDSNHINIWDGIVRE